MTGQPNDTDRNNSIQYGRSKTGTSRFNETALCVPGDDQHYLPRTRDFEVLVLVLYFEGCRGMAVIGMTKIWKMRPKKGKKTQATRGIKALIDFIPVSKQTSKEVSARVERSLTALKSLPSTQKKIWKTKIVRCKKKKKGSITKKTKE